MSDQQTRHYALRPLEKSDLNTVGRWFQDLEDLAAFDRTCRVPLNPTATEQNWAEIIDTPDDFSKFWFAITDDIGGVVGLVGINGLNPINRDAVVALFVDKSVRRHGVGIRATALVLDLAFRQLGLNRVTSYYREDNTRSAELLAALGVTTEGRMRNAWFSDGKFHDMLVVGILAREWAENRDKVAAKLDTNVVVNFGADSSQGWTWPSAGDY